MAVSKTALILVLVATGALCWENLPSIPAGRRAEYYLLHDDGAYKHGYDTGEGQAASASADASNQVQGQWQYVNDEGQRVNWAYTAGDVGFVPVLVSSIGGATFKTGGSNIGAPSGSAVHSGSAHGAASDSGSAHGSGQWAAHGAASHSGSASRSGAAHGSAHGAGHGVDADHADNADASYNFNFDTSSYSRDEQADSLGNIHGRYAYNSPVGGSHAVSYKAGADTGFVVLTSTSQDAAVAKNAAPAPAPAPWTGPLADINSQINPDGSFAFSYTTGDHEHHQSGDAQNNVRGSYSVKSGGATKRVDYNAGAATGFVATGDHLPVAPAVPAVKSGSHASSQGGWTASSQSGDQGAWAGQTSSSQDDSADSGDASYSYNYNTDTSSKQETSDAAGNVAGSFTYLGGDGVSRKLTYTSSGDNGFIATGDHLPVAPAVPAPHSASGNAAWGSQISRTSPPKPDVAAWSGQVSRTSPPRPDVVADEKNDGSYSYSYSTGDQSVQQSSDADNNVHGSYSFKAKDDGQTRTVNWQAGGKTGFVAQGAHLPVPVVDNAGDAVAVNTGSSSGWNYGKKADANAWSNTASNAGSANAWSNTASKAGSANAWSNTASTSNSANDGSFSYSYSTDDQSVQQSSDANNNVKGSYSFKAKDDGVTRRVDYTAGAATGFVATGDHLPVAPAVVAPQSGASWNSQTKTTWTQPAPVAPAVVAPHSGASWNSQTKTTWSQPAPVEQTAWQGSNAAAHSAVSQDGSSGNDGSYSYSYSTDTQSVQQSSDANNNVRGSYSFKAKDDGVTRKVDYTAGAETGFIATGDHLPVAPAVPAPHSAAGSAAWSSQRTSPPKPDVEAWSGHVSRTSPPHPDAVADQKNDGSYSYSYNTGDQSVQQSSDANNNVHGSYSFKAKDDGQTRTVNWQAGSATGFVAQGAHLPVAPEVPAVKSATHATSQGSWAASGNPEVSSWTASSQSAGQGAWAGDKAASHDDSGDASYSYSYKTDSSSKQETSDAAGNVAGSFTYLGGDGVSRKLTYTAHPADGFQASGAHLPVAPLVGEAATRLAAHTPLPVAASHNAAAHSVHAAHSAHGSHAAHAITTHDGGVVVSKYLPPVNHHKFGYIFDTKA